MNIHLINNTNSLTKNISAFSLSKYRTKQNSKPTPETSKDEISFKGYTQCIGKAALQKINKKSDCEAIFFDLFEKILEPSYKKTYNFEQLRKLYTNYSLHGMLKCFIEKNNFNNEDLALELIKRSEKQDLIFATFEGMPVFEFRNNGMPNFISRNFSIKPDNVFELRFNSEFGGSSCIFGINPRGELSFTQISNLDLPKYTLFHKSNDKVKIFTQGESGRMDYAGTSFNPNGSVDHIKSLFLH